MTVKTVSGNILRHRASEHGELEQKIIEAHENHLSENKTASLLRVGKKMVRETLREHGMVFQSKNANLSLSQEKRDMIIEYRKTGMKIAKIAKDLDISVPTVKKYIKQKGMPLDSRTYSAETVKRILELHSSGNMTNTEIGLQLNLPKSVVSDYLRKNGLKSNKPKYKTTKETLDKILELNKIGRLDSEIARELGVSRETVSKHLKLNGREAGLIALSRKMAENIIAAAKSGEQPREIAKLLKISRTTVDKNLKLSHLRRDRKATVNVSEAELDPIVTTLNKAYIPRESIRLALDCYLNYMNLSKTAVASGLPRLVVKKIWDIRKTIPAEKMELLISSYNDGIRSIQILADIAGTDTRTVVYHLNLKGLDASDRLIVIKHSAAGR